MSAYRAISVRGYRGRQAGDNLPYFAAGGWFPLPECTRTLDTESLDELYREMVAYAEQLIQKLERKYTSVEVSYETGTHDARGHDGKVEYVTIDIIRKRKERVDGEAGKSAAMDGGAGAGTNEGRVPGRDRRGSRVPRD